MEIPARGALSGSGSGEGAVITGAAALDTNPSPALRERVPEGASPRAGEGVGIGSIDCPLTPALSPDGGEGVFDAAAGTSASK